MGLDYALVHIKYTIPPAVALTLLYKPFATKLCLYKILFLIAIAIISTIPWDSYLIRQRIWSYPPNAIVGPTLYSIPAEEIFFFFIQTYLTSLLYLLVNLPTFHPIYLCGSGQLKKKTALRRWRHIGSSVIVACLISALGLIWRGGRGLYLGLIIAWAGPFILLLWSLGYQFLLGLPSFNILGPILLPTFYLWIVDTLALKRGTWVIESGTKLNWHLWDGLDIEEAIFFLVTNVLVVFGLVAFDNALAIIHAFPLHFPTPPSLPSPWNLVQALLLSVDDYDEARVYGLKQALDRLKAKSRSFYLASATFQGRLRIDLILLYSFCRVADDLVDEAKSCEDARVWIQHLRRYLDLRYANSADKKGPTCAAFISSTFPDSAKETLRLMPTNILSAKPLYELLNGFETDLTFSFSPPTFPISNRTDLDLYGMRVAGTVAESCLQLVYHHCETTKICERKTRILESGRNMGIALQYINIARDIGVDAANSRVYIPTTWLKEAGMVHDMVLHPANNISVEALRTRLLDRAMAIYIEARQAIEDLPVAARAPMRVAVESYVEIGRVLRKPGYKTKAGRATVGKLRRLQVAWAALSKG